jgi:hypothetical protein
VLSKQNLDSIIEEIAKYEIELVEDPSDPQHGAKYLQRVISQCRHFMNRVMYYMQTVNQYERGLKTEVRQLELDIDLKSTDLLANDIDVRQRPNIKDRDALISSKLRNENLALMDKRVELLDVEETLKIIKMKYNDLRSTNSDIKLQRQIVKDNMDFDPDANVPKVGRDKSIAGGLPPDATVNIDVSSLLDPNTRPDDIPEPVDPVHARQLVMFYGKHQRSQDIAPVSSNLEVKVEPDLKLEEPSAKTLSYSDLLD